MQVIFLAYIEYTRIVQELQPILVIRMLSISEIEPHGEGIAYLKFTLLDKVFGKRQLKKVSPS